MVPEYKHSAHLFSWLFDENLAFFGFSGGLELHTNHLTTGHLGDTFSFRLQVRNGRTYVFQTGDWCKWSHSYQENK